MSRIKKVSPLSRDHGGGHFENGGFARCRPFRSDFTGGVGRLGSVPVLGQVSNIDYSAPQVVGHFDRNRDVVARQLPLVGEDFECA
jgi:hypothetical protein